MGGFGIREDNGGRGDDRRSHGRGRGKTSFIIDNDVVAVMINGIGRGGGWMWCKALALTIDHTVVGIMTMLTSMTMEGERGNNGVMKIEYFGTYLRYLPTNPTSHRCDNIPANPSWIPDISRYHFRISTSSSTVELVHSITILFDDTS